MGNVGVYSIGAKGVNQIVQSDRTECLAGISREGLTRETQLSPSIPTLRIPVMCKAHASFHGMLSREMPAKIFIASIA